MSAGRPPRAQPTVPPASSCFRRGRGSRLRPHSRIRPVPLPPGPPPLCMSPSRKDTSHVGGWATRCSVTSSPPMTSAMTPRPERSPSKVLFRGHIQPAVHSAPFYFIFILLIFLSLPLFLLHLGIFLCFFSPQTPVIVFSSGNHRLNW